MEMKQMLEERKLQYSTVKNPVINYSTVQYSSEELRMIVESLDRRLYCNPKFIHFYKKAVKVLGPARVMEFQAMVLDDERINQPDKFCAEKVFCSLLRDEVAAKLRLQANTHA